MAIGEFTNDSKREFKSKIRKLLLNQPLGEDKLKDIEELVYRNGRVLGLSIEETKGLSLEIFNQMYGLDVIQKYIDDKAVNEIMVNGLKPIIIEKNGVFIKTEDQFDDLETLINIIQLIVSKVNRRVNTSSPIVDARLDDGSRVNIVIPPISLSGPIITIRKFQNDILTLEKLVARKMLTKEASDFLKTMVLSKYNIFISGGTSTGKTTFLNALSEAIPTHERIVTIEDSAELALKDFTNLVSLETKPCNSKGEGAIGMDQLIITALRMRPDRIIVGEVRGKEALEMLNAMNTGHDGSLSTGHSNSSSDMISRLEIMILKAMDLPVSVIRRMISSSIDILIHINRDINGRRYLSEINEIKDDCTLNPLFAYDNGLKKRNDLMNKSKLIKNG